MNKYRDPSISPEMIKFIMATRQINHQFLDFCLEVYKNDHLIDDEYYHLWVTDWKAIYNSLSQGISKMKRDKDEDQAVIGISLSVMKKMANTMLNARQYAKDRRRSLLSQ